MDVKRRLLTNTAAAYVGTAVSYAAGIVFAPFFIHRLGADAYGIATLLDVFAISGWAGLLDVGIQASTIRYVAEHYAVGDWRSVSRIVSTAGAMFAAVGAIAAAALFAASGWLAENALHVPPEYQHTLVTALHALAIALAFQFPGLAVAAAVEGTQRADLITGIRVLTSIGGSGVAALLVLTRHGVLAYMLVLILAPVVTVAALVLWLRRARPQIHVGPAYVTRETARRLLGISGSIFLMRLASLVFANSDKIVIGAILTAASLTQYAVAAKLYGVVFTAGVLMNSAVLSAASHYHALEDRARLQAMFLRGTKYAVAVSVPLAAAMAVLAPEICAAWIGPDYRSSGVTTQIWLISIVATSVTGIGGTMLIGINRIGPALWLSVGSAVVNLAVTIPGAFLWGVNGVVLGTTVAWTVLAVPFVHYLLRALDVPWRSFQHEVIRPTIPWICTAAAVSGIGLLVLPSPNLAVLLAVLLGGVACAWLGFFRFGVAPSERASLLHGTAPESA